MNDSDFTRRDLFVFTKVKDYRAIDSVLQVNEVAWAFYNSNPKNEQKNNMGTPEIKKLLISLAKIKLITF
jgi:hypothetical protein